jgi:hypothetical protein
VDDEDLDGGGRVAEAFEDGEPFGGSFFVWETAFDALFFCFREEECGAPPCGEVTGEGFLGAEVASEDPDPAWGA